MERHGVDPVRPAAHRRLRDGGRARDLAGAALEQCEVVRDGGRTRLRGPGAHDFAQPLLERVEPAAAHRHRGHHRHAQLLFERCGIEQQPVPFGEVDHVERHHHRQPQRGQLEREPQVIVEIGGVDHHDHRIGQALARLLAEQHVAGNRLVRLEGSRL